VCVFVCMYVCMYVYVYTYVFSFPFIWCVMYNEADRTANGWLDSSSVCRRWGRRRRNFVPSILWAQSEVLTWTSRCFFFLLFPIIYFGYAFRIVSAPVFRHTRAQAKIYVFFFIYTYVDIIELCELLNI